MALEIKNITCPWCFTVQKAPVFAPKPVYLAVAECDYCDEGFAVRINVKSARLTSDVDLGRKPGG
jgi:hypothetical protein